VRFEGSEAVVELPTPQRAVSPGQSAVFYRGDEVLGGGFIRAAALRVASRAGADA
jgi:tRNA U34 2-thiouridine synthase MnmA/TrmU